MQNQTMVHHDRGTEGIGVFLAVRPDDLLYHFHGNRNSETVGRLAEGRSQV